MEWVGYDGVLKNQRDFWMMGSKLVKCYPIANSKQ
jgi:hypothetical protein